MLPVVHVPIHEDLATFADGRRVDVACERCGCRFRYRLVRRATGRRVSLGGASEGADGAAAASRAAAAKVAARLTRETDPVPCPDCGHYQAEMVRDVRRRYARSMLPLACFVPAVVAVLGPLALVGLPGGGWWPPARADLGGWLLLVTLAAGIVLPPVLVPLARRAIASTIDPNRLGAPPPRGWHAGFPAGADGSAGRIAGSVSPFKPTPADGDWITVQLLGLTAPAVCGRCLAEAKRVRRFRCGPTSAGSGDAVPTVPIAFCPACDRPYRRWWALAMLAGAAAATAVVSFWIAVLPNGTWLALVSIGLVAAVAGAWAGHHAFWAVERPFYRRRFSPDRNTVELQFKTPGFAPVYAEHAAAIAARAAAD